MLEELISYQTISVASLFVLGLVLFVFDISMPTHYREMRLNIINFLMFLFVSTATLAVVGNSLRSPGSSYLTGASSTMSLFAMLFVAIWMVPNDLPADTLTTKVEPDDSPERQRKSRLFRKIAYSSVIFLGPLLLVAHVHKNRESYVRGLHEYDAYVSGQTSDTGGNAQDTELTVPKLVENGDTFSEYGRILRLFVSGETKLTCEEKDPPCQNLKNRILAIEDNRAIFLIKVGYYFLLFYLILNYYGKVIQVRYKSQPKDERGLRLQQDVVKQCSQVFSISAAFITALIVAGVNFTSLGVFGGLIGAGLSVALKDLLGNIVAGVLLLWDRTIKKNDVITISQSDSSDTGSTYAIVEKMTMRYTVVQDRNEVRRLIPNSILTNSIVENWTHEGRNVRLRVLVGVAYGTDLRLARTILESICYEVDRILTKGSFAPKAVVLGFGDSSINFALRFWIDTAQRGIRPVLSDLYIAVHERFKEEGITIPYPRRDLRIMSPDETIDAMKPPRLQKMTKSVAKAAAK